MSDQTNLTQVYDSKPIEDNTIIDNEKELSDWDENDIGDYQIGEESTHA